LLPGARRGRVERDQLDGIAYADLAAAEDSGVDPALARVPGLADPVDV